MAEDRVRAHFLSLPNIIGVSFMPGRIQVKLKSGSYSPGITSMEGIPIEYVYEDVRPAI